jgi:hypothetical protein
VTDPEMPRDPRAMDDEELAQVPEPPPPVDPPTGSAVAEDDYAQGQTADPDGADRDVPAGEDYAGSGF